MNAGKHVLCEKPMAVTLEECMDMVKAADENGEISDDRAEPEICKAHVKAKELISEGVIGDVITFKTTFGHGGSGDMGN